MYLVDNWTYACAVVIMTMTISSSLCFPNPELDLQSRVLVDGNGSLSEAPKSIRKLQNQFSGPQSNIQASGLNKESEDSTTVSNPEPDVTSPTQPPEGDSTTMSNTEPDVTSPSQPPEGDSTTMSNTEPDVTSPSQPPEGDSTTMSNT
ncbi:hypothetical protein BOX15_Mlig000998g1, partial [Macrostomum lignano]